MNTRFFALVLILLMAVCGARAGHTNVARYTFEGNSVHASDASGNGNHISISGSSGGGSAFITNAAAVGSYAAFFNNNGGAGYAYLRPSANVLTALAGSFSFSLWLKTTQVSGSDTDSGVNNAGVASAFNGVGPNWIIPMALTGSKLAFVTGGSPQHTLRSTNAVNTGSYVHVVVTRDQATGAKKIYRNGVLDDSGTGATDMLNTPTELTIGSHNSIGFSGSVDDIQIYSGVLSAGEIAALYATPGSVAPNVAGGSFDSALNTSGLTWTTGGQASWFVQTTNTHDNVAAAQSGAIDDDEESWIQTTVTGPGTLIYWWKVSSDEDLDYLEFILDGTPQDEITGDFDWQPRTNAIAAGTHTLRWRYFKDDCCWDGSDAGFLDQVSFVGPPPVTPAVKFSLEIVREQRAEFESSSPDEFRFWARPGLSATNTPLSIHQVESPGGYYSATFGTSGSSSASISTTFTEMANRVTNGNWTLWLNKNTASEQVFQFTVSALSFASNDFAVTTITAPLNGATTVASNTPYQWSIPGTWNDLFVQARQVRFGTNFFYAFAFPASNVTTWAAGPVLAAGTNFFNVRYQKNVPANFAVSTPYPGWSVDYIRLENSTTSGFIVADNSGPPPNLNIALTTSNNIVVFWPSPSTGFGLQENTNGIGGVNWSNITTTPTDNGTTKTVIINPPTGNRFYRLFKP